ncbi:MAG: DUF1345 domain-containing protein [Candidatus Dadabacteria bacterium]
MTRILHLVDNLHRDLRLLIAAVIGFVVFFYTRQLEATMATSFMVGWMFFAGMMLLFTWNTILLKHPRDLAVVASKQDNSRAFTFVFVLLIAVVSAFAIILLLRSVPGSSKTGLSSHVLLTVVAVGFSWSLIHTLFTIRYAHLYYLFAGHKEKEQRDHMKGLLFPGHEQPDFIDFAYFSFVLGMTFQVSDVQITSRKLRHLALIHGLISFVYNTIIVALSINIISGVIGK